MREREAKWAVLFDIVAEVAKGKRHDWQTIADRMDVAPPAARRYAKLVTSKLRPLGFRFAKAGRPRALLHSPRGAPFTDVVGAILAGSLASLFKGSEHEVNIRRAREHLLLASRRAKPTDLDRKFLFHAGGGDIAVKQDAGLLDDVVDAVLHSHALTLEYDHVSRPHERVRIEPLSLVIYERQLYVLSRLPDGTFYPYRLSRIESARRGKEFAYPTRADYDPDTVFGSSLGMFVTKTFPVEDVELRLTGAWARYAETHKWHPTQEVVARPARGELVLRVHVRICPEVERWVLGFGPSAEVLKPASLREKIAATLSEARALYEGHERAHEQAR